MSTFEQEFQKLNPQQRKAVETIEGPVMVVAGPGTGKTQMLALRIANILKTTDAQADNILCITFTEAGAKAMRQRLIKIIGREAYKVNINTFHGFANEVIQTFPEKFEFKKEARQLDDLNKLKIIKGIIEDFEDTTIKQKLVPFGDKYSKKGDIISAIGNLKKEAISPDQLRIKNEKLKDDHLANQKLNRKGMPTADWKRKAEKFLVVDELAVIYEMYQKALEQESFYDFEDMILFVINKLEEDEELLSYFQERYLYIHVDEYQDTNGSQNRLLNLLTNFDSTPNIFVVGDDDQAIYRFQGASLENILFFGKSYTNVQTIPTPLNYRSTQVILDIADSLIQNNSSRLVNYQKELEKRLRAHKPEIASKAEVLEFNTSDEENLFIAKEIKRLHEKGVDYSEIAVIYRKNFHSEDINETLSKFGVPTYIDSSKTFLDNTIIKQFINLLKTINLFDKNIDSTLYEVMLYEFFNIRTVSVYKLVRFARQNKLSLIEILIDLQEDDRQSTMDDQTQMELSSTVNRQSSISKEIKEVVGSDGFNSIKNFAANLLRWHKMEKNIPIHRFLEIVINESGLLEWLTRQEKQEIRDKKKEGQQDVNISNSKFQILDSNFEDLINLNSFFNFVKDQYVYSDDKKLQDLLNDIEIIYADNIKLPVQKIKKSVEAVNLLTAHSSKGLEFEYVFIAKSAEKNWGGNKRNRDLLPKEIYSVSVEGIADKDLTLEDERRLFFVAITRAKLKVYFTYANEYVENGQKSSIVPSRFIAEIDPKHIEFKSKEQTQNFVSENDIESLKTKLTYVRKPTYDSEEKDFLLEQIANLKMTPSSLNKYLESPEEFKLEILVKYPKAKTKEEALGTSVHFALEKYNRSLILYSGEKLSSETFIKEFEECLHKEFYGDEDYEKTLEEGRRLLKNYYDQVLLTDPSIPNEIEYNFYTHNVFLNSDKTDPIPLNGRIDKLTITNADLNEVCVTDYKTSTPHTEKEIKDIEGKYKAKEWRQLVFYKLLGDLDTNFRPNKSSKFPKYNIQECEIDYIKPNQSKKFVKRRFTILNSDVDQLKELIEEVMIRIRNLEFPPECELL